MSCNLLYRIGGEPTNVATLGEDSHAAWWLDVDEHFERYRVQYSTAVDSWADFEQFEATLANSLGMGPLHLATFPRGRARVVSLVSSGGTLVNTLTGTEVQSLFPESIETKDRFHWAGRFSVTFVRARVPACTDGPNLFFRVGGSASNTIALGALEESAWTPDVDDRYERYECALLTDITSWATYEAFETSLANSLGLGPLQLNDFARGGSKVVSWTNSGGALVNAATGTVITSVWPVSIEPGDHAAWSGRLKVTFLRPRAQALTGANLFFRVGGSAANTLALGAFEYSDWTPDVDGRYERYHCAIRTDVESWADYAAFETTLANSLALGPLEFIDYPRGRSKIISWTNSAGALYNAATGETIAGVYPESISGDDHEDWTGKATVTFVRARKGALTGTNLFFRVGASAANTLALGAFEESDWTPEVDGRFVRYRCAVVTDVDTWADYETFEASLAGSLGLGDLKLARYPRDGAQILSWSNSGGTLYNALTGTTVDSVFPESIAPEDHAGWTGRVTVTFVGVRRDKLGGSNLFFHVGADPGNAVRLGALEESEWTPEVDERSERYACAVVADVRSWTSYETMEATLAASLALGPLKLVTYPRGGARIVSFANSGGALVNSLTGTTVESLFPESIRTSSHDDWDGKLTVTFVRVR